MQSSKDIAKNILQGPGPSIEELSGSSSSKKSGGSDLDYRQKTEKWLRTIRRFSKDPRIQEDLEVMNELSKSKYSTLLKHIII